MSRSSAGIVQLVGNSEHESHRWRPPLWHDPSRFVWVFVLCLWQCVTLNKARFHNYVLTIPEPKPRDSKTKPRDSPTKAGALPQLHSHDSTTTLPRFHNQNLRIPQPNSHDSTTKTSGFHNQNLAILQLTTIESTRKTAATDFHCRKFLTSYKKLKSPTPAKQ